MLFPPRWFTEDFVKSMQGYCEVTWGQGRSSLTHDLPLEVRPRPLWRVVRSGYKLQVRFDRDSLYTVLTLARNPCRIIHWTGWAMRGGMCMLIKIKKNKKMKSLYSIKLNSEMLPAIFFTLIPPLHMSPLKNTCSSSICFGIKAKQ